MDHTVTGGVTADYLPRPGKRARKPLRRLAAMADQVSLGQTDVPEFPVRGRDEIAELASSFGRMRKSLVQALRMLEAAPA